MLHPYYICNICLKNFIFSVLCSPTINLVYLIWNDHLTELWLYTFACKMATLLSAGLHLLHFCSCSDLHTVIFLTTLMTCYLNMYGQIGVGMHTQGNISNSVWLAHYITVTSQMPSWFVFSSAVLEADRQSPFPSLIFAAVFMDV